MSAELERRLTVLERLISPEVTYVISTGVPRGTVGSLSAEGLEETVSEDMHGALERLYARLGFRPTHAMWWQPCR